MQWYSTLARNYFKALILMKNGGEDGIRTHVGLQTLTRFPSVRHQPLGHLSLDTE